MQLDAIQFWDRFDGALASRLSVHLSRSTEGIAETSGAG